MLINDIETIKSDISIIKSVIVSIPEWIPISEHLANEYGYKSIDGFRNYCLRNIHPSLFQKKGRVYHLHRSALGVLKK